MKNFFNLSCALLIAVVLVIGCGDLKQKPGDVSDQPPITIDAKTLTKEYADNELAADAKYKNKNLVVSGKVSDIAETLGSITVQLQGHANFKNVLCSFDEAQKVDVMKLKKGQTISFAGIGDGSTGGLYVGLQKCRIQ